MLPEDLHISDQELLLTADGETSSHRAALVRAHLESCWDCRARMAEIESTIVDFARAHRKNLDPQMPPVAGPRALLRARLAELAAARGWSTGRWFPRFTSAASVAAICSLLFAAGLAGSLAVRRSILRDTGSSAYLPERGAVPDRSLTPGATRPVSIDDVCSMAHEETIKDVSTELRQKVFEEYGIENARSDEYEVDYLIAPGLGGADDIHNLWPEPYRLPTWNARVKDALEERLHQLVCAHELDLSTAQREIATDWIAAYRKYFHTESPVSSTRPPGSSTLFAPRVATLNPFSRGVTDSELRESGAMG
jgi:hypothetical protein